MNKRIIAMMLAVMMIVTSGCSSQMAVDKDGNVSVDGVPVGNLYDKGSLSGEQDKESGSDDENTQDDVLSDLPTKWDLTDLFADEDAFEADMKRVEALIPKIESFRGTLNSAEGIQKMLEDPDSLEIKAIMDKATMYTQFVSSLDPTNAWAGKANARYNEVMQKLMLAKAFEEPEIMAMPLEKRREIFSDERLAPYAYSMSNYTDPDYTVLSEEAKRVATLMENAQNNEKTHDIFDYVELPHPSFTYPDGTEATFTDEEYSKIVQSSEYDHEFRKEIYGLRHAMRQPYANTYASLLEGRMRGFWADAQINNYDSSLEAALADSDVEPEIYDRIIKFSHDILPKVYEYYEARKEILGLDEMMLCDLNQPVSGYSAKEISYEDAVNIGRKGISVWGDEYLDVFDKIITKPHIDVYPSDTKATGAFEYLVGNQTTPYVLFNFDDSESYISTIVHEMGHAVYSELSAENQNVYNNNPLIFTQEVASTANEIMLSKYMIENSATKEEKIFWLDKEINLFLGTLIRQCMYSEFEDYCYKTIENGGSLNANDMSDKWLELQHLYYGDAITVYDDSGIDWARISHYYNNYYVYQYATSVTYAASICNKVDEKGQDEIDAYLEFLKAGNSASPSELLRIAEVDPLADETYEEAGELISELIDEFIKTAGKQD
ncbi:MAG: hypothetical protein IJT37_12785 [Lachnospiraceae bacterium]|nr:hypothetical protein [Lachnospiraceae bacterium]